MADAVFDGTDVMGEFVGKGSGVAYETSNALAQRVVEALASAIPIKVFEHVVYS